MTRILTLALLLVLALGRSATAQPLYNPNSPINNLFGDPARPQQVGDMVNIVVQENMTTAKVDDLTNDRELTTISGGGGGIMGFLNGILGNQGIGLNGGQNERTTRSDSFVTIIPTQVVAVLPNGYLQVEGIRDIKVNSDKLNIATSGIIRPRDVDRDGKVLSSKVAEFQMLVQRKTHRGIIDNLFRILF